MKHTTLAVLGLAVLTGLPALAGGKSCCDTSAKAAAASAAKPGTTKVVKAKAAKEVEFTSNVKSAMARAAKEKKLVMVDVYTDWCGWCKRLDKDVYTDSAVINQVQKGFVALKVNPEKADKEFVGKYGVRGYPTILFLDAKGREVHRVVGYKPAKDFLAELKTATSAGKRTASAR